MGRYGFLARPLWLSAVGQHCSASRDESLENWGVPTASILFNTHQNQLMLKMALWWRSFFKLYFEILDTTVFFYKITAVVDFHLRNVIRNVVS